MPKLSDEARNQTIEEKAAQDAYKQVKKLWDEHFQDSEKMQQILAYIQEHELNQVVVFGDSLSDPKHLYETKLFGFLDVGQWAGLADSDTGRFSDSLNWVDYMTIYVGVSQYKEKHNKMPSFDEFKEFLGGSQSDRIQFDGNLVMKNYAVGGASAHNYSYQVGTGVADVAHTLARFLVPCLDTERDKFLRDEAAENTTTDAKARKRIIDLSGANDYITVNSSMTYDIADRAVAARLHNVRELYKAGYRKFTLVTLPDISLTPRYQQTTAAEIFHVHTMCEYMNAQLRAEIEKLRAENNEGLSLDLYDINEPFGHTWANASAEDRNSMTSEIDHQIQKATTQEEKDALLEKRKTACFYNDVHPAGSFYNDISQGFMQHFITGDHPKNAPKANEKPPFDYMTTMAELWAKDIQSTLSSLSTLDSKRFKKVEFSRETEGKVNPEEFLKIAFLKDYLARYQKDKSFSRWSKSRLFSSCVNTPELSDIFCHAFFNGGKRSLKILAKLNVVSIDFWGNAKLKFGEDAAMNAAITRAYDKALKRTQRPSLELGSCRAADGDRLNYVFYHAHSEVSEYVGVKVDSIFWCPDEERYLPMPDADRSKYLNNIYQFVQSEANVMRKLFNSSDAGMIGRVLQENHYLSQDDIFSVDDNDPLSQIALRQALVQHLNEDNLACVKSLKRQHPHLMKDINKNAAGRWTLKEGYREERIKAYLDQHKANEFRKSTDQADSLASTVGFFSDQPNVQPGSKQTYEVEMVEGSSQRPSSLN